MIINVAYTNFNGGQASERLKARYTHEKYPTLSRTLNNFIPQIHGGLKRRSGMRFIAKHESADSNSCLIPFSFNVENWNNYIILLTDELATIYDLSGKIAEFETIYAGDDVKNISYAQVGDIVYLAHEDYSLHKILRSGSSPYTWSIEEVVFNVSLDPPENVRATFNSGNYDSDDSTVADADQTISYVICAVDSNYVSSIVSEIAETKGRYATDWISGDNVTLSWSAVEGAVEYNIYKESAGYYGYISTSTTNSFTDQNYEPDVTDTPLEDWFPFDDGNNPSIVAFHQQRMLFAGTKDSPQSFYLSRTGDFENFRKSRPSLADDPVEYTIASGAIDAVQWCASFGDLIIGTSGAEYKVTGEDGTGSAITSTGINITTQSYYGSSKLAPIIVGYSVLHAQRYNAKVRDLSYSLERDGYAGNDLTVFTPEIFAESSIRQWAFQQKPNNTLFCVRNDGKLFTLTYMTEQKIYAWAEHETNGNYLSVINITQDNQDVICFLVERDGQYFIEYLSEDFDSTKTIQEACFLDSSMWVNHEDDNEFLFSIPEHLQEKEFSLFADGSQITNYEIIDNAVKLNYEYDKVLFGYNYTSMYSMFPYNADLQNGSTIALKRSIGEVTLKVNRTVGGVYGKSIDDLYDIKLSPNYYNSPYDLFSGEYNFIANTATSTEEQVFIGQDKPLPMEIISMVCAVDFQQTS